MRLLGCIQVVLHWTDYVWKFELPLTLPGVKPLVIKKGQGIWLPVYGLHHDPKYFEKQKEFDPERFLGERKKHILNCRAYLSFGLGPRMCISNRFALLETKVVLFHLFARCKNLRKDAVTAQVQKRWLEYSTQRRFLAKYSAKEKYASHYCS